MDLNFVNDFLKKMEFPDFSRYTIEYPDFVLTEPEKRTFQHSFVFIALLNIYEHVLSNAAPQA